MNHTKLSRHQRLAVKPVVFAYDAKAQRTFVTNQLGKMTSYRLQNLLPRFDLFFAAPASASYFHLNCDGELAEVVPLAPAAKAPPVPSTNP